MTKSIQSQHRAQTLGEEIANSVSHGIGFLAAAVAAPVLVYAAVQRNSAVGVAGAGIFAFTMMLMYITSTLYHALTGNKTKRVFRILDHDAIFLMIAGSACHFIAVLKYAA